MTLLNKAKAAKAKDYSATGALFLWDAAYATLIGVEDGKAVGGVCKKRDKDFVTATNGAVKVRDVILKEFQKGKTALIAADTGEYNAGYHAEGFCYWRGMAGYFASKSGN